MTQTPVRPRKHEGFDRTGDFCSRVKLSQDLAQVINDGLCYYEDHQFDDDEEQETWIDSKNVSLITQAEFDKLKSPEQTKKVNSPYVCCPQINAQVIILFFFFAFSLQLLKILFKRSFFLLDKITD